MSLWEIYIEFDPKNKGYLTDIEFDLLLRKLGIILPNTKVEQLMRIIDTTDKKLAYNKLEAKILKYGLIFDKDSVLEKISWSDRAIKSLIIGFKIIGKQIPFDQYLKRYDYDYDGLLTTVDFVEAIKGLKIDLKEDQIQRLGHIFQTNSQDNRISVKKIIETIEIYTKSGENERALSDLNSIGEEIFEYIINNYEGMSKMFNCLGDVKKNIKELNGFLKRYRKNLRSFRLIAFQYSLFNIKQKVEFLIQLLQKGMYLILKQSHQIIVKEAYIKYIDPVHNKSLVDKDVFILKSNYFY